MREILLLAGFWLLLTGGGFGEGELGWLKDLIVASVFIACIQDLLKNLSRIRCGLILIFMYAASRILAKGTLDPHDFKVIFYAILFMEIYFSVEGKVRQNILVAIYIAQFALLIIGYTEWQIEASGARFALAFEDQFIDPNLSAVCFVFVGLALASVGYNKRINGFILVMALIACMLFESRSAFTILFAYILITISIRKLLYIGSTVFICVASVGMASYYFESITVPERFLNIIERFDLETIDREESAEGARFAIYNDIKLCIDDYSSVISGCDMSVQKNPHNELLRGYVDGGLLGLIVILLAIFQSFKLVNPNRRPLLFAGYVPMLFYGFTFYQFVPIFFSLVLNDQHDNRKE